ncbi:TPA: hypothetical protein N0F65_000249 [Lagenidium giganteum]|uniref:FYVE-type domain-containing protein n=1 Tax=Lagenidium giganteum TaxID=4803 RepID=A0AAV2Z5P7_9STRA|nr:TPA: hypothetical protein N0F65_000249 [Lagenidium giganteum]
MKFPLPRTLVPSIDASTQPAGEYELMANSLVQERMKEYQEYVGTKAKVPTARWKQVKRRENLTIYKDTKPSSSRRDGIALWMAGSFAGSLNDAMYGIVAADSGAMRVQSSYMGDDVVDGAVLLPIQKPTVSDPFRFVGIKWLVKSTASSLRVFTRARDYFVLESTGVMGEETSPNRIGFHLVHSIDLSRSGDLEAHGITRGRVSVCFFFQELRNGTVDVYMKARVGIGSSAAEAAIVSSAADTFLVCWKTILCGKSKKLAQMVRASQQNDNAYAESQHFLGVDKSTLMTCGRCSKGFGTFGTGSNCRVCRLKVCSKCRLTLRLSKASTDGTVKQTPASFCKHCVGASAAECGLKTARQELKDNEEATRSSSRSGSSLSRSRKSIGSLCAPSLSRATTSTTTSSIADSESSSVSIELGSENGDMHHLQVYQANYELSRSQQDVHGQRNPSTPADLYEQMARLRVAAAVTAQVTKQNAHAMQSRHGHPNTTGVAYHL